MLFKPLFLKGCAEHTRRAHEREVTRCGRERSCRGGVVSTGSVSREQHPTEQEHQTYTCFQQQEKSAAWPSAVRHCGWLKPDGIARVLVSRAGAWLTPTEEVTQVSQKAPGTKVSEARAHQVKRRTQSKSWKTCSYRPEAVCVGRR